MVLKKQKPIKIKRAVHNNKSKHEYTSNGLKLYLYVFLIFKVLSKKIYFIYIKHYEK